MVTYAAIFLARAAWVWGASLLLWELAARIGAGLLPAIGLARPGPLGRFGFGLLLGWSVLGLANLGLALAGLFHPLALVATALALALASRAMWEPGANGVRQAPTRLAPGSLIYAASVELAVAMPRLERFALSVALGPVVLALLLPETGHDSWLYHLGVPWQYLMAGRATVTDVWFTPYHVPILFEMAYALPLALGDDRLAKGIVLSCFLAAAAVFAWFVARGERSSPGVAVGNARGGESAKACTAAYLGPLLVLGSTLMLSLVVTCKSDVPASALFVAGALLTLSGGPGPGWLFVGLAAGAKFVYWPLAGVWFLFFFRPAGKRFSLPAVGGKAVSSLAVRRAAPAPFAALAAARAPLAMLFAPSLVWWAREWLVTGNPVWPFGSGLFPSLGWGNSNREAFDLVVASLLPDGMPRWRDVPVALFGSLHRVHLPVLLLLPGLLFLPRDARGERSSRGQQGWPSASLAGARVRRAGWACLAASALVLGLAGFERYLLPSTWLLALLMAREFGGGFAERRASPAGLTPPTVRALVVGYVLAVICLFPEYRNARWGDMGKPWSAVRADALTKYLDVERILLGGKPRPPRWLPRAPRPPRVLSVGEWRTYGFPARILFNGMFAETPLVWSAARDARDVPGVAKRIRQYGADSIMINYLTVEWQEIQYTPFRWERDPLRRWVDYCRSHLELAGSSAGLDNLNGGFHVFRVLPRPRPRPLATVWFAPGSETAFSPARPGVFHVRALDAMPVYMEAFMQMPDVAYAWNLVGHMYTLLEDMPNASRYLKEFGESGIQDSVNLTDLAGVAVRTGELDLAERTIARALPVCPDSRPALMLNRASLCVQRALRAAEKARNAEAVSWCDAGLAALDGIPPTVDMLNSHGRRSARVFLLGIKGETLLEMGKRSAGIALLETALELGPDSPPAAQWRAKLGALSRPGKP